MWVGRASQACGPPSALSRLSEVGGDSVTSWLTRPSLGTGEGGQAALGEWNCSGGFWISSAGHHTPVWSLLCGIGQVSTRDPIFLICRNDAVRRLAVVRRPASASRFPPGQRWARAGTSRRRGCVVPPSSILQEHHPGVGMVLGTLLCTPQSDRRAGSVACGGLASDDDPGACIFASLGREDTLCRESSALCRSQPGSGVPCGACVRAPTPALHVGQARPGIDPWWPPVTTLLQAGER